MLPLTVPMMDVETNKSQRRAAVGKKKNPVVHWEELGMGVIIREAQICFVGYVLPSIIRRAEKREHGCN